MSVMAPRRPAPPRAEDHGERRGVDLWRRAPVIALGVLAVLLRLPYLGRPLSPDEGGFLLVASQWHPGTSLYGDYWVDRPPLLIAWFWLADLLGGQSGLRVLGALAAGITVLGIGFAVDRLGGRAPAVVAAATAAALLVSPLAGAMVVNGELLAAPFVAVGVWMVVLALDDGPVLAWPSAGACAAAAVLVKQNMLDVVVFAVVGLAALWILSGRSAARPARSAVLLLAGFVAAGSLALGTAALRGTAPGGVLFAMYPFRLEAAQVIGAGSLTGRTVRLQHMVGAELLSLGPVVIAASALALLLRRRRLSAPQLSPGVATLALAGYAVLSVLAGGSYWMHYLVQLAVPTGLAAGLLAVTVRWRAALLLVAPVLVVAAVSWSLGLTKAPANDGDIVGSAVGRAARPGDTMVNLLGDPATVQAAGLHSPYPYLWSLPARTLDPGFRELHRTLTGPQAPTWLVLRPPGGQVAARPHSLSNYRLVERVCHRAIYLRVDTVRPVPIPSGTCGAPRVSWLTDVLTDVDEVLR